MQTTNEGYPTTTGTSTTQYLSQRFMKYHKTGSRKILRAKGPGQDTCCIVSFIYDRKATARKSQQYGSLKMTTPTSLRKRDPHRKPQPTNKLSCRVYSQWIHL